MEFILVLIVLIIVETLFCRDFDNHQTNHKRSV